MGTDLTLPRRQYLAVVCFSVYLATARDCWLVTLCYALSQALVQMWLSCLVISFTQQLGLSEQWCATLGMVLGQPGARKWHK